MFFLRLNLTKLLRGQNASQHHNSGNKGEYIIPLTARELKEIIFTWLDFMKRNKVNILPFLFFF